MGYKVRCTGIKEVILRKDRRHNKIIYIRLYKGFQGKVKVLQNKGRGKNLLKHIENLLAGVCPKKRYILT